MKRKHYARSESAAQNAAKTLLANIRFAGVDGPLRTIAVTSAVENEGKSTIAMHLAQAIATSGKTVLLIEADMRRRSLADMLGVRSRAGIYAVLVGQVALEDAVIPSTPEGMYFLDCEPGIPSPSDVLASKRFRAFLSSVADKYDYVVFDTPPVGAFVDAAVLSSLVDGTLLVVREDGTPRDAVLKTYEQLKKADANVLGVVMNFCDYQGASYGYGYGYESYESYETSRDQGRAKGRAAVDTGAGSGSASQHGARAASASAHASHAVAGASGAAENPRAAKPMVPANPGKTASHAAGGAAENAHAGKRFAR